MMHDQKKALGTIMSKRTKSGETMSAPMNSEISKNEDGEPDGRHSAAQDMIAALNEKSPQKLMEAMAAFHDLHALRKSDDAEDLE